MEEGAVDHEAKSPSDRRAIAPEDRRRIGQEAEALAEAYLRGEGWTILARNVYFRVGELDIVAEDAGVLVFVEVRGRWTRSGVRAADSVGLTKQRRLSMAAQLWLARHAHYRRHRARFDVVSLDLRRRCVDGHYRGCFDAQG